jgi:hypothetical protein
MFRLLTFFVSAAALLAFVWFGLTVDLGERTLFGHLRAIGGSNEAQQLWTGTKDKVTDFVGIEAARRAEAAARAAREAAEKSSASRHASKTATKTPTGTATKPVAKSPPPAKVSRVDTPARGYAQVAKGTLTRPLPQAGEVTQQK